MRLTLLVIAGTLPAFVIIKKTSNMTTFKNTLVGSSVALMALVSLALPFAPIQAADLFDGGYDVYDYSGGDYGYDTYDYSGSDYGYDVYDYSDSGYDVYDYSGSDYGYDVYDYEGSSYGGYSYGGGGSMPYFPTSYANQSYRSNYSYPTFYTPPSKSSSNSTVTTNTCVNNSCNYTDNSIVDNSVKISNSFNNQKQKKQQYNDCYDYDYGYGYNGYSQGYGQQGYNYGSYNYDNHCYTYAAPIAYNTTPYITLSQAPYTGLDLGPVGEVLYWTFMVLWCLGAAYLIVVKRVQNKLVGFLNGFLFGSASATAAHSTHAPARSYAATAPAPVTEDGIDPFIASQIKRS